MTDPTKLPPAVPCLSPQCKIKSFIICLWHCVVVFCLFDCYVQIWPSFYVGYSGIHDYKRNHVSETDIPEIKLLILLSQQIKWQATGDNGEIKILLKHNIYFYCIPQESKLAVIFFATIVQLRKCILRCVYCLRLFV